MHWTDEGFLLSKNNFNENSIIIEVFTLNHGKYSGIVYGGSSRKQKRNFQIGNKILIHLQSKGENKPGYFNIELLKPISPYFFHDKKKTTSILSAASILKILLPERQINKNIFNSFEKMLNDLKNKHWIQLYIHWELLLIKELGYDVNLLDLNNTKKDTIEINNRSLKIPKMFFDDIKKENYSKDIYEALKFNKKLLIENFILPNNLKFPLFRNILENYYI